MPTRDLFDRIAKLPECEPGVLMVPPPELVAFTIMVGRRLRSWKKRTLATFAGVSLSTVERAERGEIVQPESLDRISTALGYGAGYFTAPRCPKPMETVAAEMEETYGDMVAVEMAPLRTERQVRALIRCDAYLPHCPELPGNFEGDVDGLVEWLDCAAFMTSDFVDQPRPCAKRKLYGDILNYVRDMESRGLHVLAGVMEAPQPGISDWKVAIVSTSLKAKDPGAPKRSHVFVDRRVVVLRRRLRFAVRRAPQRSSLSGPEAEPAAEHGTAASAASAWIHP